MRAFSVRLEPAAVADLRRSAKAAGVPLQTAISQAVALWLAPAGQSARVDALKPFGVLKPGEEEVVNQVLEVMRGRGTVAADCKVFLRAALRQYEAAGKPATLTA